MERARGSNAGRGTWVIDTHRQTHQCRLSLGSLDPACQHHDARAGSGGHAPRSSIGPNVGCERGVALAAADIERSPGRAGGRRQKAVSAEVLARGGAGAACARYRSRANSRGGE